MAGGAKLPFTVGIVFPKGAVAAEFALDLGRTQVDVKRRWSDGSVKHAIVSGHADVGPGQATPVRVVKGSFPGGTPLTCADITKAAPRASVSLGSFGSVDLGALLAAPVRTWLTGPEVVECHYRAPVGGDPTLRVGYQVRLYREGRMFVRAIVENGYLDIKTEGKAYAPRVMLGDALAPVTGRALTHHAHTRWFAEGWLGSEPDVVPRHDPQTIMSTGLVPHYQQKPAAAAALSGLYTQYQPMESGDWTPHMGETGYQPQIGLLPNWDALFITSDADARAYRSVVANAKALNSYPLVWRDSRGDGVVSPTQRPTWTVAGEAQGGETQWGAGDLVWDNAHHGSGGYLAYLLTGDHLFLETLGMQSSLVYLMMSSANGAGRARILRGQTRAMAWANRTIGQYVAVAPPDAVVDDYQGLLAANAAHWRKVVDAAMASGKQLGLLYAAELSSNAYGDGLIAPWQANFIAQAFGHVSDLEPLPDMTNWNAVRDHLYRFPVGLLGVGAPDGFCFARASGYTLKVADARSDDVNNAYATWSVVESKAASPGPCTQTLGGTSGGAPESAATGYWGNLMPAIAFAVDHRAPGAAAAWARFAGASNYGAVTGSGFDKVAVWGVVPR